MTNYNILWIEDDVNGPELMSERDALQERGCVVTPVINPDELKISKIRQYDCIIIDLMMPPGKKLSFQETRGGSKTGFVLLKKIKEKYPDSKVVVYSVFNVPEARVYCNENGIEYWTKSNYLADAFAENIIKYIQGEML